MLYFEMSFRERKDRTLPKNFDSFVYWDMHEWLKYKPTMNPPHLRDLMSPTDGNYNILLVSADTGTGGAAKDCDMDSSPTLQAYSSAAAYDAAQNMEDSEDTAQETDGSGNGNQTLPTFPKPPPPSSSAATFFSMPTASTGASHSPASPSGFMGMRAPSPAPAPRSLPRSPPQGTAVRPSQSPGAPPPPPSQHRHGQGPVPSPSQRKATAAASTTSGQPAPGGRHSQPHLLSSDTSAGQYKKQSSGSTGVRRKNQGAIKLVVDATREGNERLLAGLKEMNDTAKELKTQEMEMERRMHVEEMQYRQLKDEKLLDNARLSL